MFLNLFARRFKNQFPDVPCIDTDEAHEILEDEKQKVWLVDCRGHDEYQVSKIPGINFKITKFCQKTCYKKETCFLTFSQSNILKL